MKQITVIFMTLVLFFVTGNLYANEPADYFAGDWKVQIKGTPSGDADMVMHLERVDGKLTGEMRTEGVDPSEFKSVDEKEDAITVSYSTMGYDISLTFKKVDENKLKGSLMGMFDATGERIVK